MVLSLRVLFYLLKSVVYYALGALQLLMLVRAVMSWFMPDEDNRLYLFVVSVTEPVIYPVRALLERIPAIAEMPLDLSFMVTYLLLALIQNLLP